MYHDTFSGPAGGVIDRKHKELRAIREIKKGEEVTISYLGFQLLLRDKEYRQMFLQPVRGEAASAGGGETAGRYQEADEVQVARQ